MSKRTPVIDFEEGTKFTSLITWHKGENKSQNNANRDEIVTFISYWAKGNTWMETRRDNGEKGLLRTEFLSPNLEGAALERALAGSRRLLPDIIRRLHEAPLSNDAIADELVEAPQLPGLAEEMVRAGIMPVLNERIGNDNHSLRELKWALGGETGVLANICNFSEEAMRLSVHLVPLLVKRARGLLTGEAEVGVNSVAGRSVQALAKYARNPQFVKHVCTKEIVSLVLEVFADRSNGIHRWNEKSYEKTWSANLVFAWAGEFLSGLAMHEDGRKMLRSCNAASILKQIDPAIEGATAKDYCDGVLTLIEMGSSGHQTVGKKSGFFRKGSKKKEDMGHVMISYNWGSQPLAIKLKEQLQSRGYAVWIDLEKMDGNIMVRMAEAVEGAAVILMLYSQRYADSPNCNMEAQYALQLQKDFVPILAEENATDLRGPGGKMLNFARGTKIYVDFHKMAFDQAVSELVKQIGKRGLGGTISVGKEHESTAKGETVLERVGALEKKNAILEETIQKLMKRIEALERR